MPNKKIFLDIGHFQTRIEAFETRHCFPSLAARSTVPVAKLLEDATEPLYRILHPGHWLIGDLSAAEELGDPSTAADWPLSEQYKAIFHASLGASTRSYKTEVTVWTGLPAQSIYLKPLVKRWMLGTHKIRIRGYQEQIFRVSRVNILDQGSATFLACVLDTDGNWKENISDKDFAVIDIGSRTTIFTTLLGFRRVAKNTLSRDFGTWNVEVAVRRALDREWIGVADRISSHKLMRYIVRKALPYQGQEKDISGLVDPILQAHADPIIAQAQRLWGDATTRGVWCGGGGSYLLLPYLVKVFPHIRQVDFPIWGHIEGCKRFDKVLSNG